ncbi:MAG TPA: DUF11 domain-containing protein [Thermoanaerobaculia bacterium]|jgi:uncharacterized repeat protein (TIGR01451 family)|nr:DUF11 domain-containing protein [Thermoanaerobaculia bacterium]
MLSVLSSVSPESVCRQLRRTLIIAAILAVPLLGASRAFAQVDVTATGGTLNASYTTLGGAFTAINAGTHTGTITIGISGNTTEAAPAVLNASGSGAASYTTIGISPTGGAARSISGAIAAGSPLIDFNGADNVTIDGLNSGGNSLTIANTTVSATSGTATIRFIGGATSNTITNSNIQGSGTMSVATNGATIFFSTDAVTANGNDNNTISNNNIGPAGANLPTKAILGNGSTTTTAIGNSGIVINNNNIFDYFGAAVTSSGIATNGGCNTWSITNNRFYQTGTRTWTTGSLHVGIDIRPATATSGAQGFTITGNTVGFASNTQTGTYTLTGAGTGAKFIGILFNGIVAGTTTTVSNNTVAAVSMTGVTGFGTTTASPFTGILFQEGNGITNGNTIGSQSATGSLTFSTTTTSATDVYGIHNFSSNAWTSNNNNIGGISVTNLGASGTFLLMGMRAFTGTTVTWTATGNNVGGTVASSIQLNATGTASQVEGMFSSNAPTVLTSNVIRNMTTNIGTGTTTTASMIGIGLTSTTPNHTLSQNSIFNLSNSNAAAASVVTGIQFTGATANVVQRNLIHSLTVATNSATAEVNGIRVGGGTTVYRNNMIALGAGIGNAIGAAATNAGTTGINGINEALGTNSFFHNSVYIGGAPTAGTGASYAFNGTQTAVTRSFRDNVFQNARSNAGATGKNYAIKINGTAANPAGLTINNNVYFANGSGGTFGFFNSLDVANLAAWKTAVGQDAASIEGNPQYNDPTNATPDLHIHPTNPTVIEGNGFDVGVVDDFDGQTRSGLTPVDIGADAGNFNGVDLVAPVISYTPLANTNSTANRVLTSTITDNSGVPTAGIGLPVIYYRKGVVGAFTAAQATFGGGSTYNFTIDYAPLGGVVTGDTIQYYVAAQDGAATPNVTTNPVAGAAGFTANPPAASTPPTTPASYQIVPPISGIKTVCASGCDFTTLTGATGIFNAINTSVVTGNIDIQIAGDLVVGEDGTNGLNALAENPAGSNFTVRIYPTGVARAITGAFNGALVRMNGSSRVTIDGSIGGVGTDRSLTITNTSVTTPSVVLFGSVGANSITNDTLKNCIVINGVTTSSAVVISDATTLGSAGVFSNITIQNNDVQKAFVGVFATGGTTPQGGSNLVYTQNKVDTSGANAIRNVALYMQGVNGATVSQNTVGNFSAAEGENDTGIWLATGTANATVSGNTVSNLGMTLTTAFAPFGIRESSGLAPSNNSFDNNTVTNLTTTGSTAVRGMSVQGGGVTLQRNKISGIINNNTGTFGAFGIDIVSGNDAVIKNNFVSDVNHNMTGGAAFTPDFGVIGIRLGAGTGHKVYFNSVNLFGPHTGTATTSLLSAALSISTTTQTGIDVRDNIFANNITGGTTSVAHVSVYLPSGGTAAMNLTWNNNAYYFGTDAARQGVGQAGTTAGTNFFTTLAALQAYTSTLGNATNDNASFASTAAVPFTSNTDLHLTASTPAAVASGGVPVGGITTDIDNDTRSATAPSMGADELQADLSITKNDGSGTYTAGASTTYTITASNAGPGGTTGTVSDAFPGVLTCNWTCTGTGTCTGAGSGPIVNDPVTLPASTSVTYTAICSISPAATGNLVNTASVTGVAGDPNTGNNSATDTDTPAPAANVSISKSDGVGTYTAGGSTTYTITASNGGPSNTSGTVSDNFPGVLTCNWTCVGGGAGGTCTGAGSGPIVNDPVTINASGSVTYTAICSISPAAVGNLVNTASVAALNDSSAGNDSATDTDTPAPAANVSISKSDGVGTYTAGGSTTYTITASNGGPSNTSGTVSDNFPGVLTCNWTCIGGGAGGTCTGAGSGPIVNDPVTINAGGSVTYTAICGISPAATGNLVNTASVAALDDSSAGNDSATDTDTPAPAANVSITKSDGVTTYTPGGSVTYTITASNSGPSNTSGTVSDAFPGVLTCNWTCVGGGSGGTCTGAGSGPIVNDPVTLNANGSVTYTAACAISSAATGNLVNTATETAVGDSSAGNDSATDTDTPVAQSDIAITKTVNNSSPGISTNVIFTITATNNGPSDATGVKVNDLLPVGLAYVSDLPTAGSYNSATGVWTIGALANGASATLTLTATVNRLESQVNQASTSGQAQGDGKGSNNTAAVRLNGAPAIDVQVTESVNNSAPAVSQNVIFLITAKNAGPATANGVVLTSSLPSGVTYVSDVPSQGGYTSGTGTWNVGTLAAGASATLSLTMTNTVLTPVTQTFTRTASTEQDLVSGNDAASVTLNPAGAEADLALTKIVTQEPVGSGLNFNYEVVVTNLGSGGATGVTMIDSLPAGVSLVAAVASQGSCSGSTTVTCTLGVMAAGTSAVVDLTVTKTVGGSVSNSATVSGNETDPNANNNSNTTQTTPVELIDFGVE